MLLNFNENFVTFFETALDVIRLKDDCDRLFERAFQAWIGPETAWFEQSRNCSGWSLGGSKT